MKVLMIAGESNPFIKTGGLADVVYSLSKELIKDKNDVSIAIPFYKKIKDKLINDSNCHLIGSFEVKMNWRHQYCGIYQYNLEGIKYYFIDNDQYFYRDGIYGFGDDTERFAFFNLAICEMITNLKMHFDILHLHDWQAGMIPLCIKENYQNKYTEQIKYVLTIHNPAFQGLFNETYLYDYFNLSHESYDNGICKFKNQVSYLKTAIMLSNKITTVSPTHRGEILDGTAGHGLESVICYRDQDFSGIVNGIDYNEFNPLHDKYINHCYGLTNFESNKAKNREELFKKFYIDNPNRPTFGIVSRLTWQKGINLVLDLVPYLVDRGAVLIILGSGESALEERISYLRDLYPNNILVYFGYSNELAHKIYASSDFFLMPSLFEPCGIGQMIAERYGSLPIVRVTGGLKDTVISYNGKNSDVADGFSFYDFESNALKGPLSSALDIYYTDKKLMHKLAHNAMKINNNWKKSAKKYSNLYQSIIK